jgi:hypothetical protein
MQRATLVLSHSAAGLLALPLLLWACSNTARDVADAPAPQLVVENPMPERAEPTESDGSAPHEEPEQATPTNRCVPSVRTPGPDESTPLGTTPAQMLAWLSGEHHEALAWQDDAGSFAAEAGSELTIRIEPKPDGVRWLVSNPDDPSAGFCEEISASFGDISTTFDELRFDVRMQVSTSGGELNASLDATFVADASDSAFALVELPAGSVAGRLSADASAGYLRLGISPFGNVGQLYLSHGESLFDRSYVPRPEGVVARFPAQGFCGPTYVPFSANDRIRGATMGDVLDRLHAVSPVKINDQPGTLSWSFAPTEQPGCVDLGSPARIGSVIGFPARATLRSTDQQVDGSFDVKVSGAVFAGVVRGPSVETRIELDDATTAAAAARDFGIQSPLDFSGYARARLEFRNEISGETSTGWLRAAGVNPPSVQCSAAGDGSMCSARDGTTDLFVLSWHSRPR